MKLTTTISKNLKLLFRNKESAYTIVFGPILIILLVSFAFVGTSDEYTIRVGTYAPATTHFSDKTISALGNKDYLVSVFPDAKACVDSVKTGQNHACIVFGEKEVGNGTVPVTFYIDLSRVNLAYQIADDLSGTLDVQANDVRQKLASDTLLRLETAGYLTEQNYNATVKITMKFDGVVNELRTASVALGKIPNSSRNVTDIKPLRGYQQGLAQNTATISNISMDAIDRSLALLRQVSTECTTCSNETMHKVDDLQNQVRDAENSILQVSEVTTKEQLKNANLQLQLAIDDAESIQASIENASNAGIIIARAVRNATTITENSDHELRMVVGRLNYTTAFLKGDKTTAESISKPIETSIVSVTVTNDKLSFAYPYLLLIVIMFIGMLLSSMLVVTDKTSRAAFRNFTTPTSDGYHVLVGFITAFCILIAEVTIILIASGFFIAQPLLLNPFSTISLIVIAIIIFTFIGMIIGYLSKTQEAAMITSISIGSVLIFVSNLIIPIEGMSAVVQYVTKFNPYVVLSELLKRSMLYGVTLDQISSEMLAVILLAAVLFAMTLFVQRRIKRRYFRQEEGLLAVHTPAPLQLGTYRVHNEVELLETLDKMTRAEFEAVVTGDENAIAQWVSQELRSKHLARKLRTDSKEKMILRLDKHLEKHGKHLTQ